MCCENTKYFLALWGERRNGRSEKWNILKNALKNGVMDEKEIDLKDYELADLSHVKTLDFFPSLQYKYVPEIVQDGIVIRKRGIKNRMFRKYFGENCPENHTLRDGIVYENPEVVLCFKHYDTKRYFFKTYYDAKEFEAKILKLTKI